MPEKIYTEAEVAALLERAARMQASAAPTKGAGLTLEEIKSAAATAGIESRFVELAAASASDRTQVYGGIPTGVGRTLVVRGALTEARWSRMAALFSREFGPGETTVEGLRRTWRRGPLRLTAEETEGQTLLHAETEWSKELELPIALTLVGGIATAMFGVVALVGESWTLGAAALLMAVLVGGAFAAYRARTEARQERVRDDFEATLDRCAAILHTASPVEAAASPAEAGAGVIPLPAKDPSGPEPTREERTSRAGAGRLRSG